MARSRYPVRVARFFSMIGVVLMVWLVGDPRVDRRDGRWLLLINQAPADLAGAVEEWWGRLTSDCSEVVELTNDPFAIADARGWVGNYSVPDSLSVSVSGIYTTKHWLLVEAEFAALPPAWIVIRQPAGAPDAVRIEGVWSGSTYPWRPVPFAGAYLMARVPDAPAALFRCARVRRL